MARQRINSFTDLELTPKSHRTKLTGVHIHYGHINVKETTEAITEDQLKSAFFSCDDSLNNPRNWMLRLVQTA